MSQSVTSQRTRSHPSTSSLGQTHSVRSHHTRIPALNVVITSPPWARDEPPSPNDEGDDIENVPPCFEKHPSDVASYQSSRPGGPQYGSRWWAFTLPRPRDMGGSSVNRLKLERKGLRGRSMSWMPSKEKDPDTSAKSPSKSNDWDLSISLPPPAQHPFTLSHSRSPGWDTPWTPRAPHRLSRPPSHPLLGDGEFGRMDLDDDKHKHDCRWRTRKRRFRTFILANPYVPLLFRVINIAFTTSALAVATRIRLYEKHNNIMGAVGSSPTLVIIFAPLTLIHVIAAIYLEYFGRPLGLWRTSGKLAHTLSEVLFICAWSAALSLSFDNFFTSAIPCASPSFTLWYNQLPRPSISFEFPDLGNDEGKVGDHICDDQLALICLVGVGLVMYCTNLVISLFRIFEKVKYSMPNAPLRA